MDIPPDVCVLVADHGVGDHYIVAGFAEAIQRRYGLRIWLAGKPRLAFLRELFPAVQGYVGWPENLQPGQITTREIKGGELFHAHFPGLELMRAVGYNGFHFLDAYRCRFGLQASAPLSRARPPEPRQTASAEQKLRSDGFEPAATVLISLEARSTPTDGVTSEFWIKLGAALRAARLRPLVNAAPGTQVPNGLESLSIPLQDVRAIAQVCAGVCSIRSGFSDLLCDLPIRHVVVYPEATYWAGLLQTGTTFDRYGLAEPPKELVVNPALVDARVREIAEFLAVGAGLAASIHLPSEACSA